MSAINTPGKPEELNGLFLGAAAKKWIAIITGLLLWLAGLTQTTITRVEYYVNSDPGYGNGIEVPFAGTTDVTTQFTINLAPLSEGVHVVGVRSRTANGWSIDNKWIFLKPYTTNINNAPAPNINRVEYYVDTDPGYGNATPISITPAQNLAGLAINLDFSGLAEGVHIVGVRSRDANGYWGLDNKWIFLKPYTTNINSGPAPQINRVEYYVDNDPGYGNGTLIPSSPAQDIAGLSFSVNMIPQTQGVHIIGIRSRDTNGFWSLDNKWLYLKPYNNGQPAPARVITRMEYFIDNDPGYGNGIEIALLPNTNIPNKDIFANITALNVGSHSLYIRSRDNQGAWSLDSRHVFAISATEAAPKIEINSIAKQYICLKDSFNLGYDLTGSFVAGGTIKAYLSNAAGSFASEVEIGTRTSNTDGIIKCYLPPNLPDGNGYKVRIKSSNPSLTSSNTYTLSLHERPFFANDTTVFVSCGPDVFNLTNLYNIGGYTLTWNTAGPETAPIGAYKLYAVNNNGCSDTVNVAVAFDVSTWTGVTNNSWHTTTNWSTGKVPGTKTHVIVPGGTPNPCVVTSANAVAASIQVRPGATLNVVNSRTVNLSTNCNPLPQGP